MDNNEAREFIEEELAPLFPNWKPSGPEIEIWQNWLACYNWQQAKDKLQLYYAQAGRKMCRPNAKDMFQPPIKSGAADTFIRITIKCIEHKKSPNYVGIRRGVYVKQSCRPGFAATAQEHVCKSFEQVYGGTWIVEK